MQGGHFECVVDPDPEYESERREWLVTCPDCLLVVFGEDPRAAMEAWRVHVDEYHARMPAKQLRGRELLEAITDLGRPEGVWAVWAVRDYWGGATFTGRFYDRVGFTPEGDDSAPDSFTAADIVAVEMMGFRMPPQTTAELLGWSGGSFTSRLARIPRLPLQVADDGIVGPRSAARQILDSLMNGWYGLDRTAATMLLARKRPELIPLWNDGVAARLGLEWDAYNWLWWRGWWSSPGHADRVRDLKRSAAAGWDGAPVRPISLLRVLDVALWRYDQHWRPYAA